MQERYIASADLGTSKLALTVARICGDDVQIIYYKETSSEGVRYSSVINPKKASEALRNAVRIAQDELRIEIRQLVVGLPRYSVRQETAKGGFNRSDATSCITQEEIDNLKSMALTSYPIDDNVKETIYGAVAQSFSTEDIFQSSEEDIVGATSEFLEGNFKIFVGRKKAMDNITVTLNEAGIAPAGMYFTTDAVASAVLSEEERDNGVALIEMGAGVTSLCIYQNNIMRFYASIPFGGKSITTDIKYECGFKEVLAENIKLAFGACMPEKLQSMSEKIIQINDEENGNFGQKLPVKYLSDIITCRAREIIEAMLFLIQESGYSEKLRNGIVITGGGANLANITALIKEMSGYKVRIGFPRTRRISAEGCEGISETGAAASVGLILISMKDELINCTSAPVPRSAQDEEEEKKQIEEKEKEDMQGSVFDSSAAVDPEAAQKAKAAGKKKKRSKVDVLWEKVGRKVNNALDGAMDAIGGLYDNTEGGNAS